MNLKLLKLRDALTNSFWFVPALMALVAASGAIGSIAIDQATGGGWIRETAGLWAGGPEGARAVLSVIAGSIMTVVSIVFSLTVTILAQTSAHFGPRVLRNFTSDRAVQFTLGTFIATFIYSLLVLRTVRSVDDSGFVPYLSVNIGVMLALASLAVLIFFIHHISQSIQAENIVADIGRNFQDSLGVLFPERVGRPKTDEEDEPQSEKDWEHAATLESSATGYLQRIDDDQLMHLARKHDLMLKLERRPGSFVAHSSLLLSAVPTSHFSDEVRAALLACFSLGRHRTPHQDALYLVQQLVEIAAHALSPGINEPFTALACIDWLGVSLGGVARRTLPSPLRQDAEGQLRVIARGFSFDEMVHSAFDQIRIYGATNPLIMLRLLDVIAEIASQVRREEDRLVLVEHVRLIGEDAAHIVNTTDRLRVAREVHGTLEILASRGGERT